MAIPEREITGGQQIELARGVATTRAQFEVAREIAQEELGIGPSQISHAMLVDIVKILATNMQTVVLRPKSK